MRRREGDDWGRGEAGRPRRDVREADVRTRTVAAAEFRAVYEVWDDYRAERKGRSFIVYDLGVQNLTWIIPMMFHLEQLMRAPDDSNS